MSAITDEDKELMDEIKNDPKAYQRLKDKANWEAMSLYGVLKEWGDPRKWGGLDLDKDVDMRPQGTV